jgi:ABC-type transport system involved in multi-copper enzyme maturation permease subunit
MNGALLRHTWRVQRVKLAIVASALAVWGFVPPIIFAQYGSRFAGLVESGLLPQEFARFGGGDVFSLHGAIALEFIHPISMILTSVFAVGFSVSAIAGERQRGTLEVALARPISRRTFYLNLLAAAFAFVAICLGALLAGGVSGATFAGVSQQLTFRQLPLLWMNSVLLFGAFAAIGLAASVSFDRFTPAMGVTLGIVIVMYVLEVLGSLWPRAEFLQPYSLFHYFKAKAILSGSVAPVDMAVLSVTILAAMIWALVVFPRRDLAAPS